MFAITKRCDGEKGGSGLILRERVARCGFAYAKPSLGTGNKWSPNPRTHALCKGKKKMARPRTSEPRSRQLNLRFTVSELETICKRAHGLGMRPVHFGRNVLLGQSGVTQGRTGPASNMPRLFHAQLVRLGNNLNQMVRHLHQTGDPLPADLEPLLNDIRRLIRRVPE